MVLPRVRRLPPGYKKASVIFTDKEWVRISGMARLQPHGTVSEAIRKYMGFTPNAHRLARALQEQAELEAQEQE